MTARFWPNPPITIGSNHRRSVIGAVGLHATLGLSRSPIVVKWAHGVDKRPQSRRYYDDFVVRAIAFARMSSARTLSASAVAVAIYLAAAEQTNAPTARGVCLWTACRMASAA
ncbi:MAG: hypothetical protein ACREXR_09230, partial [Gammaproteobacteria bacterium]